MATRTLRLYERVILGAISALGILYHVFLAYFTWRSLQQKLGGLGRTRMFHLLQTGELQSVKIGRRRFIPDSSLQQYIEGLKANRHS